MNSRIAADLDVNAPLSRLDGRGAGGEGRIWLARARRAWPASFAILFLAIVAVIAIIPEAFCIADPLATTPRDAFLPPSLLQTSAGERLRHDEAQLLTNARRNIDRLGVQINDLLSYNQLQAARFQVNLSSFDVRSVIANVVVLTQPLVEQKGQVLQVAVDGALPVYGDQRYLEQALVNLVANAHRHTPIGTRIAIAARETPEGVLLQVEDDGPGIPPQARELIFERFARLDHQAAGSGLGLTIVRAIVEHHGGRIWCESEPGHGASFFVLLPRHDDKEETWP